MRRVKMLHSRDEKLLDVYAHLNGL